LIDVFAFSLASGDYYIPLFATNATRKEKIKTTMNTIAHND